MKETLRARCALSAEGVFTNPETPELRGLEGFMEIVFLEHA